MKILVVPTIRENCLIPFLESWKNEVFDEIVVVEDNPTTTFKTNLKHHYSWESIESELKDKSWIISKRDSAIRCFGFYIAYKLGAKYIFTLDDDCYREENFIEGHLKNLEDFPTWTSTIEGMRLRGIPYFNLGKLKNVVLNVGLWNNVPDLDAAQTLINPISNFKSPDYNRIIPKDQYFPMCGMNLCFKRSITPLMYFPLMGQGYPYSRFDDIWCGIIMKKVCDYLDYKISCGHPFVYHKRASNPITNIVKEAPGIELNEKFWEIINKIKLSGNDVLTCLRQISASLLKESNEYVNKLGKALELWISLFS